MENFIYYIILYYNTMQAYINTMKAYEDVKEIIKKGEEQKFTREEIFKMACKHCLERYGFGELKVKRLFNTYYGD